MQNPYAAERLIQEHNADAGAAAELQALRRKAAGERGRVTWASGAHASASGSPVGSAL